MKLREIILSALALVVLSGCSSAPEDVATEMCELAKTADVKGMKALSEEKFAKNLEQIEELVEAAKSTDLGRKTMEESIAKMKDIDCSKTNTIKDIDSETKLVSNLETQQTYHLKLIDGTWKVTQ